MIMRSANIGVDNQIELLVGILASFVRESVANKAPQFPHLTQIHANRNTAPFGASRYFDLALNQGDVMERKRDDGLNGWRDCALYHWMLEVDFVAARGSRRAIARGTWGAGDARGVYEKRGRAGRGRGRGRTR